MKNPGIEKEMHEQRQEETALKLSEGHFQQMFENMINGIAYYKIEVDKDNNPVDYTFLDVNNAFEKCSGLRKKDIIGKKITKVLPGIEKDPAGWIEKYGQVARSGKEFCFEQYSQNLKKWFNITAYSPQRDYFVAIWEDITARKQAEAELINSEERLKILFEYAPDAYYLCDLIGNIVDGNKEAEKISGYRRKELIGGNILKLGLIPLAQIPKAAKLLAKNALRQPTGPDDFLLIHKNGSRAPVEIRTYPVKIRNKTFVLGIARDVSQTKQAEEALKAQKEFLEILIDTIPNPIFYKDLKGQYTGCNKAFEEAMESAKEEIIGRTVFDIAPKDIADTHYEKDNELFQNPGRQMHTGQIRQESGEIREVILNKATFLDRKGKVAGLIGVMSDITALKRAEEELRESNERFTQVADGAGALIWEIDAEGMFTYASLAIEKIFGYRPEEVLGKKRFYDFFQPDEKKELRKEAPNVFKMKESFTRFINTIIHKDGHAVILETSGVPMIDEDGKFLGYRGTDTDITERMQAEKQIRFLSSVVEQSADGMAIADMEGFLLFVNEAWARMHGYERAEKLLGQSLSVFHNEEQLKDDVEPFNRKVKEKGHNTGEIGHIRKDGTIFLTQMTTILLRDENNNPIAVAGAATDITELKLAENKLEEYNHQLKEMVRERTKELEDAQEQLILKERLSALGQLAGSVGHDLRTPLGAIKNSTYYLNMALKDPEPEIKETIEIINKEISISERIINELLDFARPKATTKNMADLNEALEAAISRVQIPSEISVEKQFQNDLPSILADSIQLGQIFTNILLNAVQAMPKGGRIIIRSAHEGESSVLISISDTGTGIPEENRSKLFEPLFTTKAKGIGLGLAMVKNLVEQHGGMIQAESRKGEGSTFTISFPVLKTDQSNEKNKG